MSKIPKSKLSKYLAEHTEKNIDLDELKKDCISTDDEMDKKMEFLFGSSKSNEFVEDEICEYIPKGYVRKHMSELKANKDAEPLFDDTKLDLDSFFNNADRVMVTFGGGDEESKLLEKLTLKAREIYALLEGTGENKFISKVVSFDSVVEYLDGYKTVDYFIDKNVDSVTSREDIENYFKDLKMSVNEIWTNACKENNIEVINSSNELKLLYIVLKGGSPKDFVSNVKSLEPFLFKTKGDLSLPSDLINKLAFSCYIKAIGSVDKAKNFLDKYENELKALTIVNCEIRENIFECKGIVEKQKSNPYKILSKALINIEEVNSELEKMKV